LNRLRQAFRLLLHVDDTPHRVALAFAIGVFIAFFPIIGIHTAMALAIAFLFRLNRVAILAGSLVNNPWTLAPLFMAGTVVGCVLLGVSSSALGSVEWGRHGWASYETLAATLRPLLLPYLIGNLALGVAGGVVSYFLLRLILEKRRQPAPEC
jgi:uncharacterized protein (DUF2062 family)